MKNSNVIWLVIFSLTGLSVFLSCSDSIKLDQKEKFIRWRNSEFNWEKPKFDKAIAYFYHTYQSSVTEEIVEKKPYSNIVIDGQLNRAVWRKTGVTLNQMQEEKFFEIANNLLPDCDSTPEFCYDPHHGIVIYDSLGFAIASATICFECSIIKYYPANPLDGQCIEEYRTLFKSLEIAIPKSLEEVSEYSVKIYNN